MTKILIDRSTVEQALEALEFSTLDAFMLAPISPGRESTIKAITALRAALANPQEPGCRDDGMPTSAEERHLRRLLALRAAMPHAYYDDGEAQGTEHGISIDFMREPVAHIDAMLRALNVARAIAKQAEPVQEPVAVCVDDICSEHLGRVEAFDHLPRGTLLYAILPQRKPLSEDEIFKIENDIPDDVIGDRAWTICFARAIERAHGIKGNT